MQLMLCYDDMQSQTRLVGLAITVILQNIISIVAN
jgi:hypothetical protein